MKITVNYLTRDLVISGKLYSKENENLIDSLEFVIPDSLIGFSISLDFVQEDDTPIGSVTLTESFTTGSLYYPIPETLSQFSEVKYQIIATLVSTSQVWLSDLGFLYFGKALEGSGPLPIILPLYAITAEEAAVLISEHNTSGTAHDDIRTRITNLTTDNITETVNHRYVPIIPEISPDMKYLNGSGNFAIIEPPTGGYSNNLYFATTASDISGYKILTYSPEATETTKSMLVSAIDGNKLIETYLYPIEVATDLFPSGLWSFTLFGRVSSKNGETQFGISYFKRDVNGVETDLFTSWSNVIEGTVNDYIQWQITQPSFITNPTDRMGARVYIKTTSNNITGYYLIGDGHGAYLNNPNRIRHSQLRALNADPAFQHIDATDRVNIDKLKLTYWDDLRFPATAINPTGAASPATYDQDNLSFSFSPTATNVLAVIAQMPHSWKLESEIHAHIHWHSTTTGIGNTLWRLEYKWTNIGEVESSSWTTVDLVEPASGIINKYQMVDFAPLSGVGKELSSIIKIKISRIGGDVLDTFATAAMLDEFDIHYEMDAPGSREEIVK